MSDVHAQLRADTRHLMRQCQRGVGGRNALEEAHAIMAEAYGRLGKLLRTVDCLQADVDRLKRGEFICGRCGLRKDAEFQDTEGQGF